MRGFCLELNDLILKGEGWLGATSKGECKAYADAVRSGTGIFFAVASRKDNKHG
jgi:hypothetical protein